MMTTRPLWLSLALASLVLLYGCAAGSSSASAGGTAPPTSGCAGQANAHCFGGPP